MKKIILIFLFFVCTLAYSQLISGRILDENNKPLEGVLVYLDNTSIATYTNQYGNFQLNNENKLTTNVVCRLIGYQTLVLPLQFTFLVRMQPNSTELHELVIQKSKFSRQQLLAAFKKNFLGTTTAGKNCEILNEDVIELSYDPQKYVLEAYCNEPIKVRNNYTKFIVDFDLKQFETQYLTYSLDPKYIKTNFFIGTSVFKDFSANNSVNKNRENVYKGSINHFFYNLIHNIENVKQFILYEGSFPINFEDHFEIIPHNDKFIFKVISPDKIKIESIIKIPWSKKFSVLYNKNKQSALIFKEKEIIIDKFGNFQPITAITFGGVFASHRLGNMLPLDFDINDVKR